jgi:ABC transporter DrrB family efflux protein
MVNNVISITDLRVVRGGREVLPGISLDVEPGVTGLLGPSGCGKSTLMRSIVGVQKIAAGGVEILGLPAGSKPLRDRVGYVTQAASVYDDLSVAENLRFFARVLGVSAIDEAIAAAITAVDLDSHRDQVVGRLSGGQRSRASLAVALLGDPDVLVLDEPTVGLDPVLRRDLWALFHRLADTGKAVLVSSHVMDEAERCDRLLLMRDGVIIANGTPAEIRGDAVAGRVLTQIRRDHRTLVMLLVLPCLLMTLLWWMFADLPGAAFDRFGPGLLAIFPFIVMFLVTSVTTLRERSSGTLERLLSMPMGKLDFLLGYALAFGAIAALQSAIAVSVSVGLLGLDVQGPVLLLGVVAIVDAVLGTALGLFVSAFAATEFQAVQFMPLVVVPQILLCGLFVARDSLPSVLEVISNALPLSYAVDAMQELVGAADEAAVWGDVSVVLVFALAGLALGAATLRRRTE